MISGVVEKALDPVKKSILNTHIVKTSKFLENLPLIENSSIYPFYFELPYKLKLDKGIYAKLNIKTNLCYVDSFLTFEQKFRFLLKGSNRFWIIL